MLRFCPIVKRLSCLLALLTAGCGDSSDIGEIYPVRGKISFDGEPLVAESTTVLFLPDAARGNEGFEAVGKVDREGNYSVSTEGKDGACPGWYKVVVTALADTPQHPQGPMDSRRQHPVAKSLLPAKYGQATTTTLEVEVVAEPAAGAYDLNLTSH